MKGKRRRTRRNKIARAVAVLNVGRQNAHANQETERVDQDIS